MEIPEMQVKIRIETDVIMDVGLMAKAFAHMQSDEQAKFLALVHDEMGKYHRSGETGTMGSYSREMQMLSIKDQLDKQPDAREFIRTLYEMTMVEDEPDVPKTYTIERNHGDGEIEMLVGRSADEVLTHYMGLSNPAGPKVREEKVAKEKARLTDEPLQVIRTDVSWPGLGEARSGSTFASFARARVTCRCKGLTGAWYKVDDRVRVQRIFTVSEGCVISVYSDGNVNVLLDAAPPPAISPKEAQARVAIPSGVPETHAARIICDPNDLHIIGSLAHVKNGGAYIGRVVRHKDDGMVVIEVAPIATAAAIDEVILDTVSQNKKKVGDLIISDDVAPSRARNLDLSSPTPGESFSDYDARMKRKVPTPSVDTCDECKGTGTWTNPINNQPSPCSKGCAS